MRNKSIIILLGLFLTTFSKGQQGRVGINTQTPTSTLDVRGKADVTDVTGFQAPRLTRAELTAKGDQLYGAPQQGTIVYITDVTGGDNNTQRKNIIGSGYYCFDGAFWQEMTFGGWKLSGNKGLNALNDFLGTTDNVDLVFKVGNMKAGLISPTTLNVAFGPLSLGFANANTLGNVSMGYGSLGILNTGLRNVAIGAGSMSTAQNADDNTAIGQGSLSGLNVGKYNIGLGQTSGLGLINGDNNILIGYNTVAPNSISNSLNIANTIYSLETRHEGTDLYTKTRTGINTDNPTSSFYIGGTFGYEPRPINGSVNDASGMQSASSLFASTNVTLPDPITCGGRVYNIIYVSGSVTITNPVVDGGVSVTGYVLNSNPGSKRVTVQSYQGEWYIIASS